MKTGKCKSVLLLLCFVSFLYLCFSSPVHAEERKTVRIGYMDYDGFIMEKNGEYSGYCVDYLQKIATYTDWSYTYVYGSWPDLMEQLKAGTIDFLCTAQKTPEREEDYLFSKYPVGSESCILYIADDNDWIYYNDWKAFDDITIAFLEDSFQNEEFEAYANLNHFSFRSAYFATEHDCFQALDDGIVDAVAMGSLARKSNYKVVARFGSVPFYAMTGKKNELLIQEMDLAQGELLGNYPTFLSDLQETYYGQSSATRSLVFTREEAQYIENAGELTVGQLRNRFPLSVLNETNGTLTGVNEDILQEICRMSGLRLVSKPIALDKKPITALKDREFDLVMGVLNTNSFHQDPELTLSNPFFSSTLSIVLPKGKDFEPDQVYTVALKTSFQAMQEYILKNYPQFLMQYYSTDDACLNAVVTGKADLLIQNVYVINYWLQKPKFDSLQLLPTTFFLEENSIAALSSADPRLMSIINKCIACIPEQKIDDILLANTAAKPYQMTFGDMIYKFRIPLSIVVILLGLCLILFVRITHIRQKNMVIIEEKNKELARKGDELEKKNADLSEAVLQAERANSAKSQFLSRMSHEIRTPMNAIVGLTNIAKHHLDDETQTNEYLTKIEASSKVLLSIINDVLDMSAIENAKLKIANSVFDIVKVLNDLSDIYAPQCKHKGIAFHMTVDVKDTNLLGDALRVNQILMNLVSNAYKFTPAGGSISVHVTQVSQTNQQVFLQFVIADTGCGMASEMLDRLFKPFEQENADTAQKYGGSGLGLSIAKNLVDFMDGAIKVESQPAQGTTFTVDLPFGIAHTPATRSYDRRDQMRAIIVDDDKTSLRYTAIIVEGVGIACDVAASATEALAMMTKKHQNEDIYDLCFIDWKMPDMDGISLVKEIRKLFGKDTMIILVSSYDISEVQDEAKAYGVDLFLTKPLFQSTVFNTLIQFVGDMQKEEESVPEEYDFTGHRVLLAEDNELNTEISTELLQMVSLEVDHAENGQKAVDLFISSAPGTYDLILMDVQMPVMNGYEATKLIRDSSHPDAKSIQIFATTANAFAEDISHSLSAGMDGHISKPIDASVLYQTIYHAIHK